MKIVITTFRTLILLTSLSLLSACGGGGIAGTGIEPVGVDSNDTPSVDSPSMLSSISLVTIPFREHGYSNFEALVLNSQDEYTAFIDDVKAQASWNDKASFLQGLQSASIDFTKQNLIIYRMTETSGSNTLTPKSPALINNKVTVVIDRVVPEVGTDDMAYYGLAYAVDNSIEEVVFDNGTSQISIDTSGTPATTAQGRLVRSDSSSLLAYFQESIKRSYANSYVTDQLEVSQNDDAPALAPVAVTADTAASGDAEAGVSSTNTQENGVDEADLIKTNGRYIYSVKKPSSYAYAPISVALPADQGVAPVNYSVPSDSIRIMDTQAATELVEIKSLSDGDNPWSIAGLYLHESQKQLIAISSAKQNYYANWFESYYFANRNTDVLFVDIDQPSEASVETKLSFEGQLISSRRNGDTLYMVLRNYPNYRYTNDEVLADTTTEDFLPKYSTDGSDSQPITPPEDCFVENGQQGSADIITLVAVDLSSETPQINSQCYVGSAEAIYASPSALYLATTRWDYQSSNGIAEYNSKVTTDIHKFAYDGLNFDYRGSGEVDGHLGFRQGSKSFRFSESGEFLRVVTLDEDQWGFVQIDSIEVDVIDEPLVQSNSPVETTQESSAEAVEKSPVLLSILKEDPDSKSLKLVSKLPNASRPEPIGLPLEQLYASRFIGNRAYFVTFRVTDPLYVLDLSDPEDPEVLGELKIDGYSEYLHPISENLLLGVGKDAVPSGSGETGNDGRGAWYQGVKLSLIDVTDPSNPREANKLILGKRGTESTALYSHHGLTSLKVGDNYRIAIPVKLHTGVPSTSSVVTASTYYNYTHTGLHRFNIDINNQTIEEVPALVVNDSSEQSYDDISNDRSVIINDDVFYLHNGDFWMQDWLGNTPIIGPK